MTSSGPSQEQLAARAYFSQPRNTRLAQFANRGLADDFKLRPGSTFSQDDLDNFNARQDEYRRIYGSRYGQDALKDIQRFDRVEDIPVYTEEELRQQKIERLKADPRSAYNYKRPEPKEIEQNKKVPQAVVDSYNALTAKFGDPSQRQSITQADFDAIRNALKTSKAETIKPGEVYEGPDFRDPQGNLLRDRPDSIFNPERIAQAQAEAEAEAASESQAAPAPSTTAAPSTRSTTSTPTPQAFETPEDGKSRAGRERKFTKAERKERREDRAERRENRMQRKQERSDRRERRQERMDQRKARKAAKSAKKFKRMQNR